MDKENDIKFSSGYMNNDLTKPVLNKRFKCHTITLRDLIAWISLFEVDADTNETSFNNMKVKLNSYNFSEELIFLLTEVWQELGIYLLEIEINEDYTDLEITVLNSWIDNIRNSSHVLLKLSMSDATKKKLEKSENEILLGYHNDYLSKLKVYKDNLAVFIQQIEAKDTSPEEIKRIYLGIDKLCEIQKQRIKEINDFKEDINFRYILIAGIDIEILDKIYDYSVKNGNKYEIQNISEVSEKTSNNNYFTVKKRYYENISKERIKEYSQYIDLIQYKNIVNQLIDLRNSLDKTTFSLTDMNKAVDIYQKFIDDFRENLTGVKKPKSLVIYNKGIGLNNLKDITEDDIIFDEELSPEYNDYISYYQEIITLGFSDEFIETVIGDTGNLETKNLLKEILILKPINILIVTNNKLQVSINRINDNDLLNTHQMLNNKFIMDGSSMFFKSLSDLTVNSDALRILNLNLKIGKIKLDNMKLDTIGVAFNNVPRIFAVDINTICDEALYIKYIDNIIEAQEIEEVPNLYLNWSIKDVMNYSLSRDKYIDLTDLVDVSDNEMIACIKHNINSIEALPIFEAIIYCYERGFNNLKKSLFENTGLICKYSTKEDYTNKLNNLLDSMLIGDKIIDGKQHSISYVNAIFNLDNFIKCLNAYFTQMGENYKNYITLKDLCCFRVNYKNNTSKVYLGYIKEVKDTVKFRPLTFDDSIYLDRCETDTVFNTSLYMDLYSKEYDEEYDDYEESKLVYAKPIKDALTTVISETCRKTKETTVDKISKKVERTVLYLEPEKLDTKIDSRIFSQVLDPYVEDNLIGDINGRFSNYKLCCLCLINSQINNSSKFVSDVISYFSSVYDNLADDKFMNNEIYKEFGDFEIGLSMRSQIVLIDYMAKLISDENNMLKHKLLVPLTINNTGTVMTPFGMRNVPAEDLPINCNGLLKSDNKKHLFYAKMFTKRFKA